MTKTLVCTLVMLCAVTIGYGQTDIRKIDFKNFTYTPLCISDKPQRVTVKDGEYSKETQMDGYVDRFSFYVMDVAYGDLNGDGDDEAVVIGSCNTGGTGNFSEGFVYTVKTGKPVLAARIAGGDRAYSGLRWTSIADGILSVDRNDVGDAGGACCPEYAITTKYKLNGGKLVAFGKPVRRELYPTQRLAFDRGASSKTFTVSIDNQELKRFTVGARAGQTMTVSTNTDKASLRLLDEATVTEGQNSFTAKLPTNSDYTFEVQNLAEAAIDVTVTVKIK